MYVFRIVEADDHAGVEFLQLRRTRAPMRGSWQPIMGRMLPGEPPLACAIRETREEVGLDIRGGECFACWALEQVHPFLLPDEWVIVMSPRFAARVSLCWSPLLNEEHDAHRWVAAGEVGEKFFWPGQRACCREVIEDIVLGDRPPMVGG